MTSQGSPYARFRRALARGNLAIVRAAAAELPRVDLADALAITLLIEAQDEERYERAAVRWIARFALECPGVAIDELRTALDAVSAAPSPEARAALAEICSRHGVRLPR